MRHRTCIPQVTRHHPAWRPAQHTQLFRALTEIADETGRIKRGGEDNIRVASLAADK